MEQVNPIGSFNDIEGLQYSTEFVTNWIEMKFNIGILPREHSW